MPKRPPGRLEEVRCYVRSGGELERIWGPISCKDKKKICILPLQANEFLQKPEGNSGADRASVEPPDENSVQLSPGLQACEPPLPSPRSRAEELAKLCLDS